MSITDELQLAIDAYLGEIKNRKSTALALKQQNYENIASAGLETAKSVQEETNRDAYKAYANYINPYGVQREAQNIYGLNSSGIAQSNNARAYSAYQNRLSQAQSDYSSAQSDIYTTLMSNSANLLSEEYGLQAEYLQNLMESYNENYWKELNYNYKLNRDSIEDERYEREWEYMLSQNAYSSSSSSSSRKSSSSSNSNSKYTHTSQTTSPLYNTSGTNDYFASLVSLAENTSYANLNTLANQATNNGTTAADKSTAQQILNVGKSSNLSKEQLDALSKVLGGVKL